MTVQGGRARTCTRAHARAHEHVFWQGHHRSVERGGGGQGPKHPRLTCPRLGLGHQPRSASAGPVGMGGCTGVRKAASAARRGTPALPGPRAPWSAVRSQAPGTNGASWRGTGEEAWEEGGAGGEVAVSAARPCVAGARGPTRPGPPPLASPPSWREEGRRYRAMRACLPRSRVSSPLAGRGSTVGPARMAPARAPPADRTSFRGHLDRGARARARVRRRVRRVCLPALAGLLGAMGREGRRWEAF